MIFFFLDHLFVFIFLLVGAKYECLWKISFLGIPKVGDLTYPYMNPLNCPVWYSLQGYTLGNHMGVRIFFIFLFFCSYRHYLVQLGSLDGFCCLFIDQSWLKMVVKWPFWPKMTNLAIFGCLLWKLSTFATSGHQKAIAGESQETETKVTV